MANILVVDDDKAILNFLSIALQRREHHVTLCENGIDAQKKLDQDRYDLLLTDIVMPGIDGVELAQYAKTAQPDIKIMFMTGFAAITMSALEDYGLSNPKAMAKPFHLNDLIKNIDSILSE